MPVNGKQKGNRFEREVSNTLSSRFAAFTGLQNSFRRSVDSGSFYGGTNQSRTETHSLDYAVFGDIVCPRNFNFTIECKNYKDAPTLSNIVTGNVKQWDEWIEQASQDAKNANKKMLLIIKYNRTETFCVVEPTSDFIPKVLYKGYYIVSLSDFLQKDDTFYFTV